AVAQTAIPSAPLPPAKVYSTRTLANGLQVVVVEDHAAAVAQEQLWVRFGSLYETKGKTGLAHGLEHMMFRGTPELSGGGLDDVSARLGALVNAQTQNDTTHFYYVLPSDKVELAIRIDADRLAHLSLKESDWKLEKGAVLSEIENDYSQPIFKLYDAVRRAAFPHSPYGLTALGEKADVERSTASDLRKYYEEWYAPNNATLVVTGDVKPDDVFRWAQEYFGPIPARTLPAEGAPALPAPPRDATVSVKADYPYTVLDLAYRTEGDLDKGTAATNVVASVIDNQRSPFYKALVESGITLGYQAFDDTTLHSGTMHVLFVLAPGKTPADARKAFEATLASMRASGVPADLVDAAKRAVAAEAIYARDSISGLGDRYGYAIGVARRDPESFDADVAAVTVADANAVLSNQLATLGVAGELTPQRPKPGTRGGATTSSVSDNFSSRAPSGPIVEPQWVKLALAQPITNVSKTHPAAFTLPNGLKLYVQEVHANPTVFVAGTIRSSPAFDPADKVGLGGMTSDLLGYGSKKYDFQAQRKVTDDLAADVSLGQSFSAHGFAKDLEPLLDLIADSIRNPAFPTNYVDLVRTQDLATISQRRNNPDYLASRAFTKLLLPAGDPSLREQTEASIKAISIADLRDYATRYYRPDLARIVVVGDVKPEDVRALVAGKFGDWTADGPKPNPDQKPIPLPKPASAAVPSVRDDVSVHVGTTTLSRRDPDFYPLFL
ncbi:MAG: insulinase family protein, partial [Candidatus Eremiobacteraeota bacterium]|nr:insulinase family protein [Candidatus Eremiobacteraeota bacterium]